MITPPSSPCFNLCIHSVHAVKFFPPFYTFIPFQTARPLIDIFIILSTPFTPPHMLTSQIYILRFSFCIVRPSVHIVRPSLIIVHPSVHIVRPSLLIIRPSVHTVHPSLLIIRPSVHTVHPSLLIVRPSVHIVRPSFFTCCPLFFIYSQSSF